MIGGNDMTDLLGIPDFNFTIMFVYFICLIVFLFFAIPTFAYSIVFWLGVVRGFVKAMKNNAKNN